MSTIKNDHPVDTLGRPISPLRICSLSPSFGLYSAQPVQELKDKGWEVVPRPPEMSLERDSVLEFFRGCDGVVPGMVKMDQEMMAALPNLKVIAVHGAGVDHIDHKAAEDLGIAVCNVPGGNARAVAELALGLMLALARRIPWADRLVKDGGWATVMGCQLGGRTLGIVGLGKIGKELARLAGCMGMKLMAHGRTQDREFTERHGVTWAPLDDLLAGSDFVSLHLPGTSETMGLIRAPQLALMRPGSFLLNLGRGGVVDEDALYQSLQQGHLAGAALDVFSYEPLGESPLAKLPQVISTPHMGGFSVESAAEVGRVCAQNLAAVLEGRMPPHLVNRWSPPA
ncbi:MAG: phosphoglycerate dehydrogenase [Desulfarculaceae bacterium]|nr:phosphoglycerate dehydrogenase [Desulfarculaceae bacterium]MCF8047039.1 phosphoglycerate dehydrogenase [Desulfarculaceae bacterium]MCF8099878.1 phosphoglycerate dehydrogenase [Desulfarculaceae bacterium]MCF8122164.1 phosphoglycerate dehydrogenase [Desulfarculaceae bacterium]